MHVGVCVAAESKSSKGKAAAARSERKQVRLHEPVAFAMRFAESQFESGLLHAQAAPKGDDDEDMAQGDVERKAGDRLPASYINFYIGALLLMRAPLLLVRA